MKLQEHDYGFEAVLPENRTPFKIKTSAKLFDILSSGIYKDKILAVIRELSCNAYDAHVVAKKTHVPFKLRLPTRLDPTFYVEDEGTGIDPERITDIYWTYGESSKTNSNDQIGALGLGSKSPFAYTKSSFVVKNRYQGVEYTYLCFINEDGMPDGSKVSEEPTDKPSGVTVEFAVRPEDITAFFDRTDRFFKRWGATMPIFVDMDVSEVIRSKPEKVIEGTEWYLEKVDRNRYADHQGAIAMQGNVPYPIEVGSIPKMPKELAIIASNPFIITFDMGEINFASSREALQYDERTCNNIIARLEEVRAELGKSFQEKIFKKGMTQLQFITNFRRTFREFMTTIQYNGGSFGADTDAWYVDLLLAKKKADRISYDGRNYQIAELIQGMISFDVDGHQAFGIYKLDRRNTRSARTYMRQYSTLKYTPIDDVEGQLINPGWTATSVIRAGDPLTFEWKNAAIPKRAELTQYYRVIQNANLFEAETHHNIPVDSEKMTFFVNDCGSSGEGRYKCLVERLGHTGYLINFDPKVTPVDTVVDQLKKLIESGLKGADIVMISEQPDHRPTIEKEKIEQGTMRVKSRTLVFESTDSSISVADNVTVKAKEIDYVLSDESIVKIADLQAEPFVLYVVKRRSPTALYDDVTSHSESIVVDNKIATALAAKYVLSDLVVPYVSKNQMDKRANGRSSLRLLVLNEGQIEWLKKRKVNLKGIKEVIAERIIALDTTEKFHDAVEHAAALKRVQVISSMYTTVQDKPAKRDRLTFVPGSNSLFKQIFAEYVAVRANNAALADQYAKVKIFEAVKGSSALGAAKSEDLSGQINKKYPLLRLLNVSHTSAADLGPIIDYIEQMDNL
jgi:hypothetical protein